VLLLGKVAAAKFPALVTGMERPAVLQTLHNARPVIIPTAPGSAAVAPPIIKTAAADPWPVQGEMSYQELLEEVNQVEQDADLLAQKGPVGSRRAAALTLTGLDNGYGYERGDAALALLARRGVVWAAALTGSTTTEPQPA
jgi:hypothetical protein